MAELATIARPYAEAFHQAAGADAAALKPQLDALAALAADEQLRVFAADPKVTPMQVFDLIAGIAMHKGLAVDVKLANLLSTMIDNGRLAALPEVAAQYQVLVNADSGVSDAVVESAFPIDDAQLGEVVAVLEKRFARKLNATVHLVPELIGGIRVIVGDEVLDTSVRARLDTMKSALIA